MRTINIPINLLLILLFSCKNHDLPSLNIKNYNSISWKEKKPCTVIYKEFNKTDSLLGKIKYRGGISSKYPKHSFSLELNNKYSFYKLPKDDDWILNANYIDKTFMRHKISYDLFKEMNSKNVASKSTYINLFLNNKYEGLYLLIEEINASMIGLNKKDTMSMLFKDPPIFRKEIKPFVQDSLNNYQQKYPKINVSDKTYYIEEFKDFIYNSSDNDFSKNIAKWIDIDNVIDWHIILLFSNNEDGLLKNFYFYKIDEKTPFRFAIWDYDHSFGRDGDNEHNLMEREIDCDKAILLERLVNISEIGYLNKLKKRWFELQKNNILSIENFENHIIKNNKKIQKEVIKNFNKWPVNAKWYYDNNNYNIELNLMRDFIAIRIDQLNKKFDQY